MAAGIFLGLMAASLLVNGHYQPANALEAYKKSLRDRGEKLELNAVLAPLVPAESNSLSAVEEAFRMFVPGEVKIPAAMKTVAPGRTLVGWQQPDARATDFTNSWEEFSGFVEANRPAMEQLHQVLDKPKLDFDLDYKKDTSLSLPHLSSLKRAVESLESAIVFDLHRGDLALATTNILTMLAIPQKNSSEGLLISHLVRLAMTAIAVAPTWELLQATNVTEAQLETIQEAWLQMDFLGDATNAFVVERAWGINEIQKLRAMSHENLMAAMSFGSSGSSSSSGGWDWEAITEKPRCAIGEVMWRSSWSYTDELRTLKSESIILDALRAMKADQSQNFKVVFDAMKSRLSSLGVTNVGAEFFKQLNIPNLAELFGNWDLSSTVKKAIRMETARRLTVTAIALKRFQMKQGKSAESLTVLVPEFLSAVPIDPYDGQPLRYHSNADGTFLLYSVGEDGKDDGGDPTVTTTSSSTPSWQNDHALDWVWPQPATEVEIEMYNDEQAKKSK